MMSRELPEWIEKNPEAFALLRAIAQRARRNADQVTYRGDIINLNKRWAIIGRTSTSKEIGITERQYRTALKVLLKSGQISTIKATNRYTIVSLDKDNIFDINTTSTRPGTRPTDDQLATTNNNDNKENKLIAAISEIRSIKGNNAYIKNNVLFVHGKKINNPSAYLEKIQASTPANPLAKPASELTNEEIKKHLHGKTPGRDEGIDQDIFYEALNRDLL